GRDPVAHEERRPNRGARRVEALEIHVASVVVCQRGLTAAPAEGRARYIERVRRLNPHDSDASRLARALSGGARLADPACGAARSAMELVGGPVDARAIAEGLASDAAAAASERTGGPRRTRVVAGPAVTRIGASVDAGPHGRAVL